MIITDEMVERVWRERTSHPKPHSGFRAALEAIAGDVIEACAVKLHKRMDLTMHVSAHQERDECIRILRALKSKP